MSRRADCVLIKPPTVEYTSKYKRLAKYSYGPLPPLGLLYVASILEKNDIRVEVIDCDIENYSVKECFVKIRKMSPSIVGVTAMSTFVNTSAQLLNFVKEWDKNILCVMGGPHPTACPDETLKRYLSVDVAVRGEGEFTTLELCKAFLNGKDFSEIKGITYKEKERIIHTPNRPFIQDLDALPFPARHLLPIEKYKINTIHSEHGITTSMSTSRGCPYQCVYCGQPFGAKMRYFSPQYVMSEILDIVSLGVNHINFVDDTMTINKKRLNAILDAIIQDKVNLQLACSTRVDCVNKELLKKMKKAGFVRVDFGVESGNQNILDIIQKKITLEQARSTVKAAKDAKLDVVTYFMFGLPGETKKTVEDTIRFACELNADLASFSVHLPLPGTKTWEMAQNREYGLTMLVPDIDGIGKYSGKVAIRVNDLSEQDLLKCQEDAFKRFYFRHGYILERLKRIIRNPRKLINTIRAICA